MQSKYTPSAFAASATCLRSVTFPALSNPDVNPDTYEVALAARLVPKLEQAESFRNVGVDSLEPTDTLSWSFCKCKGNILLFCFITMIYFKLT